MSHIRTIAPDDADGPLKRIYADAVKRAGRVFNILRIQSLSPEALDASMRMYLVLMRGPGPLSRIEREAIAVSVSRVNDCFY